MNWDNSCSSPRVDAGATAVLADGGGGGRGGAVGGPLLLGVWVDAVDDEVLGAGLLALVLGDVVGKDLSQLNKFGLGWNSTNRGSSLTFMMERWFIHQVTFQVRSSKLVSALRSSSG